MTKEDLKKGQELLGKINKLSLELKQIEKGIDQLSFEPSRKMLVEVDDDEDDEVLMNEQGWFKINLNLKVTHSSIGNFGFSITIGELRDLYIYRQSKVATDLSITETLFSQL